jgi:hypothetical protein
MQSTERDIYVGGMLHKLVSSGLITQKLADQLTTMLDNKKTVYKAKKHITDLLAMLSSIEDINRK